MRASGANATKKHLEEISLCALMLMNTAKKVDRMYGVTQVHHIQQEMLPVTLER